MSSIMNKLRKIEDLHKSVRSLQEAIGRVESRQVANNLDQAVNLNEVEFRVFSQWGEDGIIQRLIHCVPIERKIFVEFGVEDYREANTRFLLVNNNWAGLVLDGDKDNIQRIKKDEIFWRHNLKAEYAFVTSENINQVLRDNGVEGDIGLLSIDIDGNDYWVWKAIEVIQPRVLIIEYNSRFGPHRAVTIPYDPSFRRVQAHYSGIYYGASLAALVSLGRQKGYDFVGSNLAGNNGFWIRRDVRPAAFPIKTAAAGFMASQFREARHQDGSLAFLTQEEEQYILNGLPLVDVPG